MTILVSVIATTSKSIFAEFKRYSRPSIFLNENKNLHEKLTESTCYLACLEFGFHIIINNIFRVIIFIRREIIKLIKNVG